MDGPCTTSKAGKCGAWGNRLCLHTCVGPFSGAISGMRFDILAVFNKTLEMGLSRLTHSIQQGFQTGKRFLGHAYHEGKKFLSRIDNYAGIAKNVIGAVAPVVGSLGGPVGKVVGAAVGGGMQAIGAYDRLE